MAEDEDMNDLFDDDLDNMVEGREIEETDIHLPNDIPSEIDTQSAKPIEVKKKVVRTPRVILNTERLCGKRGIPILPKVFENVRFKGKGHEKEDLDKLMSVMKHWSYRLFPAMCFEDVLQTIERLGTKRPVQVCLRKIRLDMPILEDDFIREDADEDDNDNNRNEENGHIDSPNMENSSRTVLSEDAFDELLKEHGQYMESSVQPSYESERAELDNVSINEFPVAALNPFPVLTEEQKERMEQNAQAAKERKSLSKLKYDGHNKDEKELISEDGNLIMTDLNEQAQLESVSSIEEPGFENHFQL